MLKEELVNENSRDEPVCLMYSGGLVVVNVGACPSVLKEELVIESSWSRLHKQKELVRLC